MEKFIKVPLNSRMIRDYNKCKQMAEKGQKKDCDSCSMNGGSAFECMGEYPWCEEGTGFINKN